ncbi:DNA polymerase III subunit delta [Mycoplasma struthionis]|uniref:DNA-directed DNA polymerase n=2 Tax=Mycoplasma struthionis TaxID=538220 RepID=A0A3G8LGM0_9MOLU|nr:hypothetical protein [Mycoplasma struthionis]AZG68833.1 hypothetical protein EGN60_02630 [Mycoplasma struthionis]
MPSDLTILTKEIDKMLLLNNEIDKKAIENNNFFRSSNVEFALQDALLKKQSKAILIKKIKEQVDLGNPIIKIFSQINNIFIQAKKIAILKNYYSNEDISKKLNMHIYRLSLFIDFVKKTSIAKINELIKKMTEIDIDFKRGYISEEILLNKVTLELIK